MLRLVLATAVLAACHPAPAPTVVRAAAPVAAAPVSAPAHVREDYDDGSIAPPPLVEIIATGHECRQTPVAQPTGPIEPIVPLERPLDRPLELMAQPTSCQPFSNGRRRY